MSVLDLDQRPGHCAFCDSPLPAPRRVMCPDPECAREYQRTRYIQRRGLRLARVVDLVRQSDGWFQTLACGHRVTAHRWKQRQRLKRRCVTCAPERA